MEKQSGEKHHAVQNAQRRRDNRARLARQHTGLTGPSFAQDPQKKLPYPNVTDTSHATNNVAHIFEGFFSAKSLHDGVTMVSFFGPDPVLYIDAGLGFAWPSRAALTQVWTNPPFSTANPDALSYPLRVIGDCHSALIEFVDTPPPLGKEFRFLSSITFNAKCQIVRWIDYWDGRSSQTKIPIGSFGPYPQDFHDGVVNASATIKKVALQSAFSAGDAAKAAQLFTVLTMLAETFLCAKKFIGFGDE
jgi:hypothetical protein